MKPSAWSFCAILWVQGYLISPDLLKLPLLFAHFLEHRSSTGELDPHAFLVMHYADAEHHAADHDHHDQLPFQHHHGSWVDHSITKIGASGPMILAGPHGPLARQAIALPADEDQLTGHRSELLRPPRNLA